MIRQLLLLAAVLAPTLRTMPASAQQTLASYTNHSRLLLLFAQRAGDPLYRQQLAALARHRAELSERDVVVLSALTDPAPPVTPETLRVLFGPGLSDQEQILARRRFHIPPGGFTVLLIGKDGGEKLRSHLPITTETLSSTIDAMPMRQQEMRTRAHDR